MKKNIPKLSVKAGACIALAIDVNADAGVIGLENVCVFVYYIFIMRIFDVICVGCVNFISCVCIFTGMIDNRNAAELLNLAYGGNIVACSAYYSRAVVNKE